MSGKEDSERNPASDCGFEWDEDSKLYFHASSGFYHDPEAGWYYSTRDAHYYTFENGIYVPFPVLIQDEESNSHQVTNHVSNSEDIACDGIGSHCPPSEWLEETLIDLYLSGYPNSEGERTAEVIEHAQVPVDQSVEEEYSSEEKIWQAQYGQVVSSEDTDLPSFPTIDLWDWKMVVETASKKTQLCRLSGRLVKRSANLHPSMPSGGSLLKTAPICGAHLDLVCVASGKVYRLRSPSLKYLSSISEFDASNPTKNWGFPDLYVAMDKILQVSPNQTCGPSGLAIPNKVNSDDSSAIIDQVSSTFDEHKRVYRDRASERRTLHGCFGIGPGQKDSMEEVEPSSLDTAAAAAQALNMSFGSESYGRRIIEKMGWKDGNSLGRSNNGILEPVQAIGNKGQAGLGWNRFSSGA